MFMQTHAYCRCLAQQPEYIYTIKVSGKTCSLILKKSSPTLMLQMYFMTRQINNFRGDLTEISAKTNLHALGDERMDTKTISLSSKSANRQTPA